jgi:hypothetical protein
VGRQGARGASGCWSRVKQDGYSDMGEGGWKEDGQRRVGKNESRTRPGRGAAREKYEQFGSIRPCVRRRGWRGHPGVTRREGLQGQGET